jgi:hypothetical protein
MWYLLAATIIVGGFCNRGEKVESPRQDDDPMIETYVPAVEEPRAELKELPIETVEGIGTKYGEMLRNAGIDTVSKLLTSKADEVAKICGVGEDVANRWLAMSQFCWLDSVSEEDAEAIVYAGGIMDLDELAEADPKELLEEIVNSVDLGHVRVPENYTFNIEMVKKWVAEAKERIM